MIINLRTAVVAVLAASWTALAGAADTGQLACKTPEECAALAAKIGAIVPVPAATNSATSKLDQAEDQFYWMNKINKASAIMLVEEKIITREMGRTIARGVNHTIDQATKPGGKRPSDVLQIESILTDAVGPDGSLIHAGRSRQDMYATFRMARLRNQVLDYTDAVNSLRERVLVLAAKNVNTIIPAYTNGVQAQPISFAHYLLAYEASFGRDAQRVQELYRRMNRSAMGTAVLANSSWPLNRKRLADLLGFDGLIENSLDSSQVSPIDISLEASAVASSGAIRLGAIMQDIHTQYHQTRPWLLLDEGSTYTSSAMPQKRNPGLIMRAREGSSNVVGLAHTVSLRAHNVTTGMTDAKNSAVELGLFPQAVRSIVATNAVFDALTVNPKRSLEELEDDWTASMELAESLQKDHQIPFRVGHTFASDIVTHARTNGLRPRDFPYAKAVELYAGAIGKYKLPDARLPLKEAEFRKLLSAENMVKSRVGIGGPQPAEVERMLGTAQAALRNDKAWMQKTRQSLKDADARLDKAFGALLAE
jgi:argininosuccinate lyase